MAHGPGFSVSGNSQSRSMCEGIRHTLNSNGRLQRIFRRGDEGSYGRRGKAEKKGGFWGVPRAIRNSEPTAGPNFWPEGLAGDAPPAGSAKRPLSSGRHL